MHSKASLVRNPEIQMLWITLLNVMNGDSDIHRAFADYLERKAANLGLQKLFLLTTRTADWSVPHSFGCNALFPRALFILPVQDIWLTRLRFFICRFVQRGFAKCELTELPEERQARVNLSRGSKYYLKHLQLDLLEASLSEVLLMDMPKWPVVSSQQLSTTMFQ